jgi:hypothetical protein
MDAVPAAGGAAASHKNSRRLIPCILPQNDASRLGRYKTHFGFVFAGLTLEKSRLGSCGLMSLLPFPLASKPARESDQRDGKQSRAKEELRALISRMRQRLYPESIPVLASYWLRGVYRSGHNRAWWAELDSEIEKALRGECLDGLSLESLGGIQEWLRHSVLARHKAAPARQQLLPPFRANLTQEQVKPYICCLLNEWLPAEIARQLTREAEYTLPQDGGISPLAAANALERLLLREHLSPQSLEMLFHSELLSPKDIYPADAEILQDVVLALLGRAWAPPPRVTPATLLCVAGAPALPSDYAAAVENASLVRCENHDELCVPVAQSHALEILKSDPVKIGSILVTLDGRWWQPDNLQSGADSLIIYRPAGRLRIDFTSDHARLTIPWPASEAQWQGPVHLPDCFLVFGREWRPRAWERNAEGTCLHLEFSRNAKTASLPAADTPFRGLRPASAEIAWSEMERALRSCTEQGSRAPIDRMRRTDLVPLGQAILGLAGFQTPSPESGIPLQQRLKSIQYFHGSVSSVYGRIPWRILPPSLSVVIRRRHFDEGSLDLIDEIFEGFPKPFRRKPVGGASSITPGSSGSPTQAA